MLKFSNTKIINNKIPSSKIIDFLMKLSQLYYEINDINRSETFRKASKTIEDNYKEFLPENIENIKYLKGIGKSVYKEIVEYLEKGTTDRLESLLSKDSTKNNKDIIDKIRKILKVK